MREIPEWFSLLENPSLVEYVAPDPLPSHIYTFFAACNKKEIKKKRTHFFLSLPLSHFHSLSLSLYIVFLTWVLGGFDRGFVRGRQGWHRRYTQHRKEKEREKEKGW